MRHRRPKTATAVFESKTVACLGSDSQQGCSLQRMPHECGIDVQKQQQPSSRAKRWRAWAPTRSKAVPYSACRMNAASTSKNSNSRLREQNGGVPGLRLAARLFLTAHAA